MIVPRGLAGIVETFGDIRIYVRPDGTLRPEWERHYLGACPLPAPLALGWDLDEKVSKIRCHVRAIEPFREVFERIHAEGLWPELRTYDGCFSYRPKRGTTKLSTHSWGIAIDLNASTNQLGEEGDMSPRIVEIFEAHSFVWGGRWSRRDDMHFQLAEAY